MIHRDELIAFINKTIGADLLAKAEKVDDVANEVQILGGDKVEAVTLGVSLNEEFLQRVVSDHSNFCIFHHGFNPRTYKSRYSLSSQKRLKLIFQHNLTIMGLHYVLDAHPTLGNNAQIISKLGAKIGVPLYEEWGYVGTFEKPYSVERLKEKCEELFGREIFHVASESEYVHTMGVVSGAGKPYDPQLSEFGAKGVQLYISGETSESSIHRMKEAGIHYFICGHYTTETFGVKALGEKISKHFGDKIAVEFIDVPNPI